MEELAEAMNLSLEMPTILSDLVIIQELAEAMKNLSLEMRTKLSDLVIIQNIFVFDQNK